MRFFSFPVLLVLHLIWLANWLLVWLEFPYASSDLVRDPFGQVVGMASLLWNPWLGVLAGLGILIFVPVWVLSARQPRFRLLLFFQVVFLGFVVFWWQFAKLPSACDQTNPKVVQLRICG